MNSDPMPGLVLVDGFNLMWRAAFGFPSRITTRDGRDVTTPFGFFALLRKALRALSDPHECIVVFDSEIGWTGRVAQYPGYKRHRRAADFSPIDWLPLIQRALTDLDLPWQESGTWEADDVIATIARRVYPRSVLVMSTDRDFHQLLDQRVAQLNTARAARRATITAQEIHVRFGVSPRQWCDYAALVGDPSDGIAGIRGIGPIRAARLLADGLRLEDLPASGRLTGSHPRVLLANLGHAIVSRDLMALRTNLDVEVRPTGRVLDEFPLAAQILQRHDIW